MLFCLFCSFFNVGNAYFIGSLESRVGVSACVLQAGYIRPSDPLEKSIMRSGV